MYNNIFDSHAHYTDKAFNDDRQIMLGSLKESGICGVINCGADIESSKASLKLAEQYDYIYFACGVHPEEVEELPENYIEILKDLAKHPKCVAIGEIGLDYYWRQDTKEKQKEVFEKQILLAKELNLPIIVHDRDAHGDTMDIIRKYPNVHGVLHSFSGSAEMARELTRRGWYISFSGTMTFKNAERVRAAAHAVPHDRLLIETDAPYLAPHPLRGSLNHSGLLVHTVSALAELWDCSSQEAVDVTAQNAKTLFGIV